MPGCFTAPGNRQEAGGLSALAAGVVTARDALAEQAVMVAGVKLAYDDAGSGDCVVL